MAERKPLVLVGTLVRELPSGDALPAASIPEVTAAHIHAAPSKTTPADADELGYLDSAASFALVKMTWANLKTWLGGLFVGKTGAQTMAGDLSVPSLNGGQLAGFRNKIINGGFAVNQRNYASGAATTAGQYTLDRWKVTGTGGITFSTSTNKTTVTIPSGQTLQHVIEGLNIESGTYVLSWEGTAQGRIAGGSYGASGSVTATITGGTNTTIEFNAGTVALVMLEIGTAATPFEHRPYGTELALCQRYYYREGTVGVGLAPYAGFAQVLTATQARLILRFPEPMRVRPTALEQSGIAADWQLLHGGTPTALSAVPTYQSATQFVAAIDIAIASGGTAGQAGYLRSTSLNNTYLAWSAEL